jgi:hypothetical protein
MEERHSIWYNLIMALIPTPQSGQPLDYAYISKIVEQVNSLTTAYQSSKTNTYINDVSIKQQPMIQTVQKKVSTNGNSIKAGDLISNNITIGFKTTFNDIPTVAATYGTSGTEVKIKAFVSINSITKNSVNISVIAQEAGKFDGTINLIAIGRP